MEQHGHAHHAPAPDAIHGDAPDATRLALAATRHCLTGCAIGEVLGLLISGALGFAMEPAMLTGIGLAFVFGYSFTFVPLLAIGHGRRARRCGSRSRPTRSRSS